MVISNKLAFIFLTLFSPIDCKLISYLSALIIQ